MNSFVENSQRETELESGGFAKGVAIAIVTNNHDEEDLCRIRVRYPWHDNPHESHWARLATPMAGEERGLMTIPEVDDEVLVAFERQDLRFPYILGALWNKKDRPPESNQDGKNDKRIFKSRKKHYLLFDDGSEGTVELKHEKGKRILLDDNGFLVEDESGNRIQVDSNSGAMTFEAKGELNIKAATINIVANGTLTAKSKSGTCTIQGSLVQIN